MKKQIQALLEKYKTELRYWDSWHIDTGHIPHCRHTYNTATKHLKEIIEDLTKLLNP